MSNWEQVKHIYESVLAREPGARDSFLDELCGGNGDLRRDVESLLAHEQGAEHFMSESALKAAAKTYSSNSTASLVGSKLDHYEIVSLLGTGGMGEVYLARDSRLNRQVALKILPSDALQEPDRMDRFIREARAASAINHPNVATIYDIGESGGVHFIAMEYVQGHTLAQTIAEHADITTIVNVAMQVADALEAAHLEGIVHRDIKPANLMITSRGQVKVLDFGIAKRSDSVIQGDATTGITMPGLVMGSIHYMSPEQVLGRAIDHRSDVFSLGVVLYEMATGRLPFEGSTPTETMDRILHADPLSAAQFNPAIPPGLEQIIRRCLEKEVDARYRSARDLITDLHRVARGDFPAGLAVAERLHNLPVQLTTFVGRSQEIADIQRLLSNIRLLTLTGAGGCGKTRLALQAAADLVEQFQDGVWLVDLAPLTEPNLVLQSTGAVLKLQEGPNRTLQQVLCDFVRHRHLLLVLDNCEHLIASCAQLAETLLQASTNLRILATSREALGVPGESVWRVPSLSAPESGQALFAEELLRYEAIRLFAERAGAAVPSFKVTPGNIAAVAEICHRLDGIPLAIELAAARLNVLSVEQVDARLKDRFRLLTGGSRTAMARQRTLEATVDWSYELLTETERQLLCRLSVFAGGWTLEAAEDVCSGNGIEREETLDLLSHLVDKSLVNVEEGAIGNRRYRFLETVRQYARERLLRSGDAERMRDRHFGFFFELGQRADLELTRADQVAWLNRLEMEHDNLRSALDWCLATPDRCDKALEFAASLCWFWVQRGYFSEGREWLERALKGESRRSPSLRAKALIGLSHMTLFLGDYVRTLVQLEESAALGRTARDPWAVGFSLLTQGVVAAWGNCDFAKAAKLADEAQPAAIESGDFRLQGLALEFTAFVAQEKGDHDRLAQLFEDALALLRPNGDKWAMAITLMDFANFRVVHGHYAQAKVALGEMIGLYKELGDLGGFAWGLETLAAVQAALGKSVDAAQLWGAADGLRDRVGSLLLPLEKATRDRYYTSVRESLSDGVFETALSEGRAMSFTQLIQYALQICT